MLGILVFAICTAGLVYVLVRRPRADSSPAPEKERTMKRPIVITLLSLGAIAGVAMAVHAFRWHAAHPGGHHEAFRQKVADICTQSALRVYEQQSKQKKKQ